MPNSKNENQDKNLDNEDLKKESTESAPKKAAEKNTQSKKTTSQAQKDKATSTDKKPAQKKSASAEKKPAPKKSAAADKKPAPKKEPAVKAASEEPKQTESANAAVPSESKKEAVKEETKETVILKEVKTDNGEITQEDVLAESFGDKDTEVIDEELENIKNVIQEDVNKIIEDSNGAEWSEIVKQSKEAKDEDEPDDEEDNAEKKPTETVKYSYLSYFAIALFSVALIAIIFLTVINWKPMGFIIKADNFDSNHKLTSAVTQYDNAVSQVKDNGGNITKRLIRREIKDDYTLGLADTTTLIAKYYSSKDLKSIFNKDISKMNNEFTLIGNTESLVQSISSSSKNYTDLIKQIDSAYKKSPAKYSQSYLEFFKYLAASYYKASTKTQLDYLNKAESLATTPYLLDLYYVYFTDYYIKSGNYDKVFNYTDKMLDINQEDMTAYTTNAKVYRLQKNYTNAFDECEKGLKINSTDVGINQQLAIVFILQGDYKSAENFASKAYTSAASSYSSGNQTNGEAYYYASLNIFALCAYLNKDDTNYEQVKGELVDNYGSVADDIASIISGTKPIKDVFLNKDGAY